jgi:hypothetical protein
VAVGTLLATPDADPAYVKLAGTRLEWIVFSLKYVLHRQSPSSTPLPTYELFLFLFITAFMRLDGTFLDITTNTENASAWEDMSMIF